MTDDDFHYTGTASLEVLADAVNYNRYLKNQLRAFIAPCGRALDFGAGIGSFARMLETENLVVDCIEADAAQRAMMTGIKGELYADIDNVPGSYERIYSLNVLEHIEDDAAALKALYSRLLSGGKLFMYVPAFMIIYTPFDAHIGHHRRYRKEALCRLLRDVGFEIEKTHYVDSLGFAAWLLLKVLPLKGGQLNPLLVKLYDRVAFPLSLLCDYALRRWLGKNLLVIVRK